MGNPITDASLWGGVEFANVRFWLQSGQCTGSAYPWQTVKSRGVASGVKGRVALNAAISGAPKPCQSLQATQSGSGRFPAASPTNPVIGGEKPLRHNLTQADTGQNILDRKNRLEGLGKTRNRQALLNDSQLVKDAHRQADIDVLFESLG